MTKVLAVNPINEYFEGAHCHHFHLWEDETICIYIPKSIHRCRCHNSSTGFGMHAVNTEAYNWLADMYGMPLITLNDNITLEMVLRLKYIVSKSSTKTSVEKPTKRYSKYKGFHVNMLFHEKYEHKLKSEKHMSGLCWEDFFLLKAGLLQEKEQS